MNEAFRITRLDAAQSRARVDALATLLIDCVAQGASVSFMWPLPSEKASAFWQGVAEGVARGERVLLLAEDTARAAIGTVQLVPAWQDNQPHRADVAKLLVHPRARRRGVAAALMAALEDEARSLGRTVLVLDTVTGGDAEQLYSRLGWQRVGVIPDYALMPTGEPCATTVFCKRLQRAA